MSSARGASGNDRDCPEPLKRLLLANGIDLDNPRGISVGSAEGWRSLNVPSGEIDMS